MFFGHSGVFCSIIRELGGVWAVLVYTLLPKYKYVIVTFHSFGGQVVAAVHFVCISLALMGSFLPSGYFFYNLLLLLVLLWSVHCRDSIDAIHTVSFVEHYCVV